MALKCVHKGCGKVFTDPEEPCIYHPGPPVFHEGQKGWKCCTKRVLTFDEFMTIPPCTTGVHSTVDDTPTTPAAASTSTTSDLEAKIAAAAPSTTAHDLPAISRVPVPTAAPQPAAPTTMDAQDDSDDPDAVIPTGTHCKRKACGATYTGNGDRSGEKCVHHPGAALFHEGSKGWTCCKRRVLEFDEFMRIPGCVTRERHSFVGKKKGRRKAGGVDGVNGEGAGEGEGEEEDEEVVEMVRSDFYQTSTTVIASLYLKKIVKERSKVEFGKDGKNVVLDLRTADGKRYRNTMILHGMIRGEESSFKIMGTKLELTLAKADGAGWPVLRAEDRHTGEIIQAGRAGRV